MEIQDSADLAGPTMHLRSRRLGEIWHWVQLLAARLYIHAQKNLNNTIQSFVMSCRFSPAVLTSSGPPGSHRCILYLKVPALDPTNTSPQPCHRERTCNRFPECRRPDKGSRSFLKVMCKSYGKAVINHDANAGGSGIRDASLPHSTNFTKWRERHERK